MLPWQGVNSKKLDLGEKKILLNDFGESFHPHKARRYTCKTIPHLRPPEAQFSGLLYFASDIWTLACAIFGIHSERAACYSRRRRGARTPRADAWLWIINWSMAYGNRELRLAGNYDEVYRASKVMLLSMLRFWTEEGATVKQMLQPGWMIGEDYRLYEDQCSYNLMPKTD